MTVEEKREAFMASLGGSFKPTKAVLTKRFNFAFRATQDLFVGMAVVNELLERPLTYKEFFASLKR